jgi:hypothetical protein
MTEALPRTVAVRTGTSRGPRITSLALAACGVVTAAAVARIRLPAPAEPPPELLPTAVAIAGATLGAASLFLLRRPGRPETGTAGSGPPRAATGPRRAPPGGAAAARVRSRAPVVALWSASALLVAEAADGIAFDVVGTVMNAVSAVTGEPLPLALRPDVPGIAMRLAAAAAGTLLVVTAVTEQRAARDACARCGRATAGGAGPVGSASWIRATAPGYAAVALALGYAAEKVYWGLGGTLGLATDDAFGDVRLWTPGLGDTAVLALIGATIALALVRPWGRRLPRWMPLTGAVLGAMMLIPVGVMGTYGTLARLEELSDTEAGIALEPWVFMIEYPWFFAWGVSLALAAVSFHHRTRSRCHACGQDR